MFDLCVFAYTYVCVPSACLVKSEKGIGCCGIGMMDACEPPGGFWGLNVVLCKSNK